MSRQILVLEDVPEMAELIRTTLQGLGEVEVRVVHTVAEARRSILKHRPDLVLLDEIIPGEAPLELLAEPGLRGVKIVLVSGAPAGARPLPAGVLARLQKWGWKDAASARAQILELLNLEEA